MELEQQDQLVKLANEVRLDTQEHEERKVHVEPQDHSERTVPQEPQDPEDHQDPQDCLVPLVLLVSLEQPVKPEPEDQLANKESKEPQDK